MKEEIRPIQMIMIVQMISIFLNLLISTSVIMIDAALMFQVGYIFKIIFWLTILSSFFICILSCKRNIENRDSTNYINIIFLVFLFCINPLMIKGLNYLFFNMIRNIIFSAEEFSQVTNNVELLNEIQENAILLLQNYSGILVIALLLVYLSIKMQRLQYLIVAFILMSIFNVLFILPNAVGYIRLNSTNNSSLNVKLVFSLVIQILCYCYILISLKLRKTVSRK